LTEKNVLAIMNIVHKGSETMPKVIDNLREIILSQAREIVVNQGIDKLTMREVSNKTCIAVGTIYNYFPTKRELTTVLIEKYWYEYLNHIDEIDNTVDDLFTKLHRIYSKMEYFVDTFKEIWVKNYSTAYSADGIQRKNIFIDKLVGRIEEILTKELKEKTIVLTVEPTLVAKFLIQNFMMMAQMKQFEYNDFDKIIRDYFTR